MAALFQRARRPLTIDSTATAAKISPMIRVRMLMPVVPSAVPMGAASRSDTHAIAPTIRITPATASIWGQNGPASAKRITDPMAPGPASCGMAIGTTAISLRLPASARQAQKYRRRPDRIDHHHQRNRRLQ